MSSMPCVLLLLQPEGYRLAANARHTLTTPRARSIIGTARHPAIRYPPSCGALYIARNGNAVLTLATPPQTNKLLKTWLYSI